MIFYHDGTTESSPHLVNGMPKYWIVIINNSEMREWLRMDAKGLNIKRITWLLGDSGCANNLNLNSYRPNASLTTPNKKKYKNGLKYIDW